MIIKKKIPLCFCRCWIAICCSNNRSWRSLAELIAMSRSKRSFAFSSPNAITSCRSSSTSLHFLWYMTLFSESRSLYCDVKKKTKKQKKKRKNNKRLRILLVVLRNQKMCKLKEFLKIVRINWSLKTAGL